MTMTGGRQARQARVTMPRAFLPAHAPASSEPYSATLTTLVLLLALPLFAQSFHYLHELTVPYLLSKAWPILTLPLTLHAMIRLRLPARGIYLVFLAYAIGVTPAVSMVHLGNGLIGAMITTVKVWPISYYFALSSLLVLLLPSVARVQAVLVGLGAATFVIMALLWLLVPETWYSYNPDLGKLFMLDVERGYRIYMPMFFGVLLMFYLTRRFMDRPHWLPLAGLMIGTILMIAIYKQRVAIAAMLAVCAYGVVMSLAPRGRRIVLGLGLLVVPFALAYLVAQNAEGLAQSLGGSLTVRQTSLGLAANYLGDSPWRWLFGVGATTRFSTVTLGDIFGNAQFYVADLGWFGVVFEYGILGALLLAVLYVWGFVTLLRVSLRSGNPMVLALSDYILFMILTSAVYSLVFTPGELGVAMAIGIYLSRMGAAAPPSVPPPPPAHDIRFTPMTRSR